MRPCPNEIVLYLRHWPSEFVPVTEAAIAVTVVSGQIRWVIVLKWDNLVRLRSHYLDKLARSYVLRYLEFKRPCENVRISISRHGVKSMKVIILITIMNCLKIVKVVIMWNSINVLKTWQKFEIHESYGSQYKSQKSWELRQSWL